ncbi:MAG: diguanylate cyclase [Endomicrobiia bacterium]
MTNNFNSVEELYQEIQSFGYNIESIVSGDITPPEDIRQKVEKIISLDQSFYSKLLKQFVSDDFEEEDAKKLWFEILFHKYKISEKLGRNVGIKVATLDYLENIKGIIKASKIIEEEEFIKTLKLATKDSLTGLYNRQHFFDLVRAKIRKNEKFCLAFLDLDGFKKYNDKEGHQAGDLILQEFAFILKEEFHSENNIIGRYGGDEFIVCLGGLDKESAKLQLEKFRAVVQEQFLALKITVSIGVCEYPYDAKELYDIIAKADELLYRVKEFGGNKVFMLRAINFNFYPEKSQKPKEVSVVGDFNNWDRKNGMMTYVEKENKWTKMLLLKPGNYRYKFLIDTNFWQVDKNSSQFTDDGFGGQCSVLTVLEK